MGITYLAKVTCPDSHQAILRERIFSQLDKKLEWPLVWISAPAGSGKTTLVSSYAQLRQLPRIWYNFDEGDVDLPSFFYYLRLAVSQSFPQESGSLPLLTPDYQQGLPTFARLYFQSLFALLSSKVHQTENTEPVKQKQIIFKKQPGQPLKGGPGKHLLSSDLLLIVMDNYQIVPEDCPLHAILASNLEFTPKGIRFILISRFRYPKQFARLRANNMLGVLDWDDLRFSPEESGALVRRCRKHLQDQTSKEEFSDEDLFLLHKITDGWAAGLVLLAQHPKLAQKATRYPDPFEDIFAYFSEEVCSIVDEKVMDFLLKTAFLSNITTELAEVVSRNKQAKYILERLCQRNCFTQTKRLSQTVYTYHPLFKDFLQKLAARTLDREVILEVRRTAAKYLADSGATTEAVQLFLDADEAEQAARLLIRMAPEMIAQGRGLRLEKWLNRIPEPVSLENPAISYWLGICRMYSDPEKALNYFHRAFEGFRTVEDHTNMILSWSGAANALFFKENDLVKLDSWMQRLEELMEKNPSFPSPRIAAEVISGVARGSVFRDFSSLHATKWFQQSLEQIESNPVPENLMCLNSLLSYNIYVGNTAIVSHLFGRMAPFITDSTPDPVRIHWYMNKAFYFQAIEGMGNKSLTYVKQGLALSRETGIYAFNLHLLSMGVHAGLTVYDIKTSGYYLKELADALHIMDYPPWFLGYHYWFSSCIQLFLLDNADSALQYIHEAVKVAKNIGDTKVPAIALINRANVFLEMNKFDQARLDIEEARQNMPPDRENMFEFMCALTEARYFLSQSKQAKGLAVLGKALSLGRRQGYYNHPNWMRSAMSMLCSRALEHGMEKSYVQSLISRRGLYPCALEKAQARIWIENWPYPVHIYTLGRFELFLDSQKKQFSGKLQKKPMEMLKVLIALGGEDIAWEQLTDILYPESEGDKAYYSFKSMLHLLRRLLQVNDALILQGGRLYLNPRYCYTDLQHFSCLSERVEKLYQSCRAAGNRQSAVRENRQQILDAGRQILNVYQGDFLPGEESFWAIEARERMRSRLAAVVQAAGDLLEKENKFMEAAKIYEQAIEKNKLQEFFYRRLMVCLHKTGRRPEAHAVYQKCCRTLSSHLGVKPSPETESTYRSLMRS